jgi:ABC-type phosphate/phosphonate transport system permease subunit
MVVVQVGVVVVMVMMFVRRHAPDLATGRIFVRPTGTLSPCDGELVMRFGVIRHLSLFFM